MNKRNCHRIIVTVFIIFFATCLFGSEATFAAVETGTSGSCPYEIDTGTLIIGDGTYCELGNNTELASDFYPWNDNNIISSIIIKPNVMAASNSSFLFYGLSNVGSFDLANLNTSKVTDMSGMFMYVNRTHLNFSLDLSSWDTSNVTSMAGMFCCTGNEAWIFNLNLSGWDTSKVTNMSNMFNTVGGSDLNTLLLNLSGWDTSNVTNMAGMFQIAGYDASNWFVNGISSWDTSKVTNMSYMFYYAGYHSTSDLSFDLSNWNTSKVTNMEKMLSGVPIGELILGPGTTNLNSSTGLNPTNFLKSIGGDINGVFTDIKDIPNEAAFWAEIPSITYKHTFTSLDSIGDTNSIVLDANGGSLSPSDVPSTVYTLASVTPTAAMIKESGITAVKPSYDFMGWTVTNTGANTYEALADYVLTPVPVPNTFDSPDAGSFTKSSQDGATSNIMMVLIPVLITFVSCRIISFLLKIF